MKLATNVIGFYEKFGIEKTIDIFAEAGFDGIDFNSDLEEYCTQVHDKAFYLELKKYASDRGLAFSQAHAPFASSFNDDKESEKRFSEIVTGIRHSAYVGAEMIVVHPCAHIDYKENKDKMFEYNMNFYKRLIPYAEEYGIKIAIENINGSLTETPEGLKELFDELDNDVFVVCFDVGHAYLLGLNPAEVIADLNKRIKCTHIHDNDAVRDRHVLPFYGNVDWESVMQAFANAGYSGDLSYESGHFVRNVPELLRADAAKYMAKVGKYLIERFEHFKSVKIRKD